MKKNFKLIFPKLKNNKINNSKILVNGILFTCIILSLSSGFVDLVFFSGLSKSKFTLASWQIPAAILYTAISIGLISMKFWSAMKIGMLRELKVRLKSQNISWYKNINKAIFPWQIAHKALIVISLITAMSMSVNSIGAGLKKIEQNVKNMSSDAQSLISLNNAKKDSKQNSTASKLNSANAKAKTNENLEQEVQDALNKLRPFQIKATELREKFDNQEITQDELNFQIAELGKQVSKSVPVATSKNFEYIGRKEIYNALKINDVVIVDNSAAYKELEEYSNQEIDEIIRSLVEKEYKKPNGDLIIFLKQDGSPVEVQTAISRLQNAISEWQSDTGDVGESSKVFTLISSYIHADEKAGGIGITEWMIMALIFIVGIIQEFAIAICTPAATISRETLATVSNYCEWGDEEQKERFLIRVYKNYVSNGIFNQADYEAKCKKCVELMNDTEQEIIEKYSKKSQRGFSKKVDEKIKEVQEALV